VFGVHDQIHEEERSRAEASVHAFSRRSRRRGLLDDPRVGESSTQRRRWAKGHLGTLAFSNLGDMGRFLTIRYRAHWADPNGQVLAEVAGTAQPRNPTDTGARHLEDVVEVMYEKVIDGLDKASHNHDTAPVPRE
jgi:hypothetical protein